MSQTIVVETPLDPTVQARATAVLDGMGLTVGDAVYLLLTRIAEDGKLPFTEPEMSEEAKAYDTWFRAKVQEALDSPHPPVSNEEVQRHMDKVISELMQRTSQVA